MRLIVILLLVCLTASGCSWMPFVGGKDKDGKKHSKTEGYSEKDFYEVIKRDLNSRDWKAAIKNLEALEAQFPFGNYAEQAQLELIYANYSSADYEAAIAAADRFIRLHPQHPNVDYAYYMKGLSALAQSRSFFSNFLPIDQTSRDPGSARDAFATLTELISRFPNSSYAADARKRLIYLRNLLARYEINVANYYFKRKAYLAAANRGRYVVENYQQTTSVPDGLAVMTEAYHLMGMQKLSRDSARVLAANYPDYPVLDKHGNFQYGKVASEKAHTWLNKLSFGLYDVKRPPRFDTREMYNPSYSWRNEQGQGSKEKHPWLHWLTLGLVD